MNITNDEWETVKRPGYFGRKRDEKIAGFNQTYGEGNWRLVWKCNSAALGDVVYDFHSACVELYERSYFEYLQDKPDLLEEICSYGECIDNAPTNVKSGCDYLKQESFSTHIQDIAVRNVLRILDFKFTGPADKILVIRSKDSDGFKFGPGNIPFYDSDLIFQPSKCPKWANEGSVEDFWQSNKWLQVKK